MTMMSEDRKVSWKKKEKEVSCECFDIQRRTIIEFADSRKMMQEVAESQKSVMLVHS
jgi:hypothetical protein